jgi:hypothetical protein
MGDDPPSKRMQFLRGWGGVHPLNTPNIISACSGGCRPSIWHVGMRRNAWCGSLRGHFRRRRPWLWRCFIACRSTNHFFRLNHGIVGIARQLLSRARRFLRCVVPRRRRRDKREKKINGKQTSIPYVGMLIIEEKMHVVLMPRWCSCPTIYGMVECDPHTMKNCQNPIVLMVASW